MRSKPPESWFKVKTSLENLPEDQRLIKYQGYRQLCELHHIIGPGTQAILAKCLNDLGVIIPVSDPQLMGAPVYPGGLLSYPLPGRQHRTAGRLILAAN